VARGHATAELLLARGARLDDAREGDKPLLNDLIRWGQMKQARWLLEKGASPDVRRRAGLDGGPPGRLARQRQDAGGGAGGARSPAPRRRGRTPMDLAGNAKIRAALGKG
jgi:hypothetical protein